MPKNPERNPRSTINFESQIKEMRVNNLLKLKAQLRPEVYEQVVSKYRESLHKNPRPITHRKRSEESAISESILAGKEVPRIDGFVHIRIHTVRKHLPRDAGAISQKALLDSIVSAGILPDDNRKHIPQSAIVTEECGQEEYTEIIIERIEKLVDGGLPVPNDNSIRKKP